MFTGLVEEKGVVTAIESLGDSVRLSVRGPVVTADATHGASISVNGCCLTVMDQSSQEGDGDVFSADVMAESLDRTSLGGLEVGDEVNLERAMQAGARMGGHIVQGHVDGTGALIDRTPSEHWDVLRFSLPAELARYLVPKGSITVQGVSLTVVEVVDAPGGGAGPWAADGPDAWFSVSLIPTTLADTTLGTLAPGDRVNLEVDVLAKYVERLLAARLPKEQQS
ncbi:MULTISPECIES: riboflavin synthase [unclassified Aeromicrobium]|uniref:riboflavin synthase n=1 Tax=unclassified Aeromicrobium TaxID=2633570 RepID=UPI0006F3C105|nr:MULTISPECIES: riboflavin synthase [unclassified Aeromicrobium]KQP24402.1 riboflavin synthase subunit alpha [Aeromicrobium sp. Leaf272]KQP76150.1 riboflavin synthase subunit alpha [Aeromicrobium sp. Leaf289]KQP80766.1 riboflavin synthase subunit alpha [Aeromicrobium sp. Leaf291]